MCFAPQRRAIFRHLTFKKWSEPVIFFKNLTYKCASRHSGVPFLQIATSKTAPRRRCFVHFDLKMCFAPQRRAIFRHLTFKKWSEPVIFFKNLTYKCASRHSGVPFLQIATSKTAPRRRCFVHFDWKMCFAPQRRAIFQISAQQLPPHPPL